MAAPKRTKTERERDYLKETELYLKGKYQVEIAEEIGITQQQVGYDLRIIQKRWIKETILNLDQHRIKELGKIDQLEREAWDAWEKSKDESNVKITYAKGLTQDKEGKLTSSSLDKTNKVEDGNGNPKYLEIVLKCIERRCKMLGIDAPAKVEHSGDGKNPIIIKLPEELKDDQ